MSPAQQTPSSHRRRRPRSALVANCQQLGPFAWGLSLAARVSLPMCGQKRLGIHHVLHPPPPPGSSPARLAGVGGSVGTRPACPLGGLSDSAAVARILPTPMPHASRDPIPASTCPSASVSASASENPSRDTAALRLKTLRRPKLHVSDVSLVGCFCLLSVCAPETSHPSFGVSLDFWK